MPILSVGVRWGRAIGWVCKPEVTGSIPVRSTELATVETAGLRMRWLARILPAGHDAVDRLAAINSGPKTLARLETAWNEEYFRSIVAV
jgi:hypothetical protein